MVDDLLRSINVPFSHINWSLESRTDITLSESFYLIVFIHSLYVDHEFYSIYYKNYIFICVLIAIFEKTRVCSVVIVDFAFTEMRVLIRDLYECEIISADSALFITPKLRAVNSLT